MKLVHALFGSFFIIILITLITGITGIHNISKVSQNLDRVTEIATPTIIHSNRMISLLWQSNKVSREISSESDLNKLEALKREFSDLNRQFSESEIDLKNTVTDEDLSLSIDRAVLQHDKFEDNVIEIYALRKSSLETESLNIRDKTKIDKLLIVLEKDLLKAVDLLEDISIKAEEFSVNADQITYQSVIKARLGIFSAIFISIIASLILVFFIYSNVKKPLENFSDTISKASKGTLNAKMENKFLFSEFRTFSIVINNMLESLNIVATKMPSLKKYISLIPQTKPIQEPSLKEGKTYLIKDINPEYSIELAKKDNRNIILISRNPVEDEGIFYIPIGDSTNNFSIPDLKSLNSTLLEFSKNLTNSAIIINRLDYFINLHGSKDVITALIKSKDIAKPSGLTIIIVTNPSYFTKEQLNLMKAEFEVLKSIELQHDLKEILQYITDQNRLDKQISFKDISNHFSITAPTTLKKLRTLAELGNIKILKKGRNKIIHTTPKGEAVL